MSDLMLYRQTALRPGHIKVPAAVDRMSRDVAIDIHCDGTPAWLPGGAEWIACMEAWPHVDRKFAGKMFVTLAVKADHIFSTAESGHVENPIEISRGTLFAFDPTRLHWLYRTYQSTTHRRRPFIGLQWIVQPEKAGATMDAVADAVLKGP